MPKQKKTPSFEDLLDQLEQTVEKMESDQLPLQEALETYQEGIALSQRLNSMLDEAEQKIEFLSKQKGPDTEPASPKEGLA